MKVAWPSSKAHARVERICGNCREPYMAIKSEIAKGRGLFCSHSCHSSTTGKAKRKNWKGDDASYSAKHNWLSRTLGTPSYCTRCGTTDAGKHYEWSNISGEYRRDLDDWQRLCKSCHIVYDGSPRGEEHSHAKLTELEAQGALALWNVGFSSARIANIFGVHRSSIKDIIEGRTWAWLTKTQAK